MRSTGVVGKRLDGDAALPYMGYARVLLGQLKNAMQFSKLLQGSRSVVVADGTQIKVQSIFGQDFIDIIAAAPAGVSAAPVEIGEPAIPGMAEYELTQQENERVATLYDIFAVGDRMLARLDMRTGAIAQSAGGSCDGSLAYSVGSDCLYAGQIDGSIHVFARGTLALRGVVTTGFTDGFIGIVAPKTGRFIYALSITDQALVKIDTTTNGIVWRVAVTTPFTSYGMAVDVTPDGRFVVAYTDDGTLGSVRILDTASGGAVGTFSVGAFSTVRSIAVLGNTMVYLCADNSTVPGSSETMYRITVPGAAASGVFQIVDTLGANNSGLASANRALYVKPPLSYGVDKYTPEGAKVYSVVHPSAPQESGPLRISVIPGSDVAFVYGSALPNMYKYIGGVVAPEFSTPFSTSGLSVGYDAHVVAVEKARVKMTDTEFNYHKKPEIG